MGGTFAAAEEEEEVGCLGAEEGWEGPKRALQKDPCDLASVLAAAARDVEGGGSGAVVFGGSRFLISSATGM